MRRHSLRRWMQFSTRCRHLYISASWGMGVLRSCFEGMTANAPRSFNSVRSALLPNALLAIRAAKSMFLISGLTPHCRAADPTAEQSEPDSPEHQPKGRSSSSVRRANGLWLESESPFCAGPVPVNFDDRAVYQGVFEVRIARKRPENRLEDTLERPAPKPLPNRKPLAQIRWQIAPRLARARNP
jgi:hypothetical protein